MQIEQHQGCLFPISEEVTFNHKFGPRDAGRINFELIPEDAIVITKLLPSNMPVVLTHFACSNFVKWPGAVLWRVARQLPGLTRQNCLAPYIGDGTVTYDSAIPATLN